MIYAMSDFHLPSTMGKSMDIFGWGDHMAKIKERWPLTDEDTIIIPGDISWALKLEEAEPDIKWLASLPGKKVLLKGNHDIWWNSSAKIKRLLEPYENILFIHNGSVVIEDVCICGTRGWDIVSEEEQAQKVRAREILRLKLSLSSAKTDNIIVFMHYPPVMNNFENSDFHEILVGHGIKKVFYGHLHGDASEFGFQGIKDGVEYKLVSADYLDFTPVLVKE